MKPVTIALLFALISTLQFVNGAVPQLKSALSTQRLHKRDAGSYDSYSFDSSDYSSSESLEDSDMKDAPYDTEGPMAGTISSSIPISLPGVDAGATIGLGAGTGAGTETGSSSSSSGSGSDSSSGGSTQNKGVLDTLATDVGEGIGDVGVFVQNIAGFLEDITNSLTSSAFSLALDALYELIVQPIKVTLEPFIAGYDAIKYVVEIVVDFVEYLIGLVTGDGSSSGGGSALVSVGKRSIREAAQSVASGLDMYSMTALCENAVKWMSSHLDDFVRTGLMTEHGAKNVQSLLQIALILLSFNG